MNKNYMGATLPEALKNLTILLHAVGLKPDEVELTDTGITVRSIRDGDDATWKLEKIEGKWIAYAGGNFIAFTPCPLKLDYDFTKPKPEQYVLKSIRIKLPDEYYGTAED